MQSNSLMDGSFLLIKLWILFGIENLAGGIHLNFNWNINHFPREKQLSRIEFWEKVEIFMIFGLWFYHFISPSNYKTIFGRFNEFRDWRFQPTANNRQPTPTAKADNIPNIHLKICLNGWEYFSDFCLLI